MSWTYTGNPNADDLSMVRFLIADTDVDDPKLSNEEINAFLGTNDTVEYAALVCVKYLVTKYAGECDYKIGPESVTASQRYKQYKQLYAEMKFDQSIKNTIPQMADLGVPIFQVGMMDDDGGC